MSEVAQLEAAIAALEAQRSVLGDAIVNTALAPLREKLAALQAAQVPPSPPIPVEQRREVTVLFADVSGFTALSETLDPEDVRQIMNDVWQRLDRLILDHGGTIDKHIGDAVMAVWGAQGAHEDDPEQAIRAALAMQKEITDDRLKIEQSDHSSHLQPVHLQLRLHIGVHSGTAILGEVGTTGEVTAIGDTVNVASRLEGAAPAGGVLISHATYRHVRGVFDVLPQPPLAVKGKREPLQTYLVRRAKPRPFRPVTRGVAGLETRTVGREAELAQLQAAYDAALEQRSVVWTQLIGEPGVGKSRLVGDMLDWFDLRPQAFRLLRARAFAGDERQAFALVRRLWFDRFQIAEDAPLGQAEAKWTSRFEELLGRADEEAAHVLGVLVGLPFADSPHIGAMRDDPSQLKGRALVVSRELLAAVRAQQPVVLLLEDLHWADQSSWEYVAQVVLEDHHPVSLAEGEGVQPSPSGSETLPHGLFILATARPEWTPPQALLDQGAYIPIELSPLSDEASRALARELLQNMAEAPDELVELIVTRAEGVPYYAEELVNWCLDQGVIDRSTEPWRFVPERLAEAPLPSTLQHLLLTRLSRLAETERAALQRGAVFGRHFWTGGVEALGVAAGEAVLAGLQPRGFVVPLPESHLMGETEWSFYHALLRDVTYESILKRERAGLHKLAAEWLTQQAQQAGRLDEFAALLAEHYAQAGERASAAEWYVGAGQRAVEQGAAREARTLFDRALGLVTEEAGELRWRALAGRERALGMLGEPEAQRADVEALLRLAEALGDPQRGAYAQLRQVSYERTVGDYRAVLRLAPAAVAAAEVAGAVAIEAQVLALQSFTQVRLGEISAARATAEAALRRAQELGDKPDLAIVLINAGAVYADSGDLARATQLEAQAAEVAARQGSRRQEARALGNLGFNFLLLGQYREGRARLEQARRLAESIGDRRGATYFLQSLGLASLWSGDGRTARRLAEEALAEMVSMGDAFGQAVTSIYLGYILEQAGDIGAAARRFAEAHEMLLKRGIMFMAVEAQAGLARVALVQGQMDEARRQAEAVWQRLSEEGSGGMEQPSLAYLTCADVFDAVGEVDLSRVALEAGYRELMGRAEQISDAMWRRSFLENVATHRTLIELWERHDREG